MRLTWLALALYSPDALAWGLQTHLFFAQYALALLPLADPQLRAAARRLPRLVLAGACLPDLAIVGILMGTPAFRRAHLWATLRRVATAPRSEAQAALAIGYASHLLSDVVAHNLFVPEHERRIGRGAMVAHIGAEWAMDQHVRGRLACDPAQALCGVEDEAVAFVCRAMPASPALAVRALGFLARGDALLRASPVPALCRAAFGTKRFDAYLERTMRLLGGLDQALAGGFQDWCGSDPEGGGGDEGAQASAGEHVAWVVQPEHDA